MEQLSSLDWLDGRSHLSGENMEVRSAMGRDDLFLNGLLRTKLFIIIIFTCPSIYKFPRSHFPPEIRSEPKCRAIVTTSVEYSLNWPYTWQLILHIVRIAMF